ncbi:MAG: STAS domain-containing protein [Bacteroidales bacterium]|nr:STAS domain-containing protein [Bacteroidales bacterium]
MKIKEKRINDVVIIHLNGRLDTANFGILEKNLLDLIDANENNILINCKKLDYVSSSGLRILLMVLKKITAIQGKFILCELKENIMEIFKISGFTSIFEIYNKQEEALNNFGSTAI